MTTEQRLTMALAYNPARDDAKLHEIVTVPAESYGFPSRWVRCMAAEILELRAQLTAAEKDAARYRYLRGDIGWNMDYWRAYRKDGEGGQELKSGDELDIAVDQAILAKGETK